MPTVSLRSPNKQPKSFKIPSLDFEITPEDAAHILVRSEEKKQEVKEIKANKALHNAASKIIKNKLIAQRKADVAAAQRAAKT